MRAILKEENVLPRGRLATTAKKKDILQHAALLRDLAIEKWKSARKGH